MEFKKLSQIIWMALASIFLVLMFLWMWSNNLIIYKKEFSNGYRLIKVNKATGSICHRTVAWGKGMSDWYTPKKQTKEKESTSINIK